MKSICIYGTPARMGYFCLSFFHLWVNFGLKTTAWGNSVYKTVPDADTIVWLSDACTNVSLYPSMKWKVQMLR